MLFQQEQGGGDGAVRLDSEDAAPSDVGLVPPGVVPGAPTKASVWNHLRTHIKGNALPPTDAEIANVTDWAKVRKLYKLGASGPGAMRSRERSELEVSVLGAMALRGL